MIRDSRAKEESIERFRISHDYQWISRWTPSKSPGTRCRWEDVAGRKFIVYGYTYNIARSCGFYVVSREIGIRQIVATRFESL